MISEWYEKHGQVAPKQEQLSDMGFIVDNRVAGWVYLTNSNLALIECVISNPDTIPSLRKESLRKLAGLLVDTAVSLGCTEVIAITKHESIAELAQFLGFRPLPDHTVYVLSESENVEALVEDSQEETWLR